MVSFSLCIFSLKCLFLFDDETNFSSLFSFQRIIFFSATVTLIVIVLLVLFCYQFTDKTTVVRFIDTTPKGLFGTIRDSHGLIQPKVKFYEPPIRPSTAVSIISSGEFSNNTRRISESSVNNLNVNINETRKGSFTNLGPCEHVNGNIYTPVQLSSPLKPLIPAYQSIEPLHISSIPYAFSAYLRDDEIALPPGYVTNLSDFNKV